MVRRKHDSASPHIVLSLSRVFLLILGLFLFATQAKLVKYSAGEVSKTSTFKSTKGTENRLDQIVAFAVLEFANPSIDTDSSKRLFFERQAEPICKIRTLFHPYLFRPPPA